MEKAVRGKGLKPGFIRRAHVGFKEESPIKING
jgi:hypothetical protein